MVKMRGTIARYKISNDGRGTYLNVRWIDPDRWMVGNISDDAGRCENPRLYRIHITNTGRVYIRLYGKRYYYQEPWRYHNGM